MFRMRRTECTRFVRVSEQCEVSDAYRVTMEVMMTPTLILAHSKLWRQKLAPNRAQWRGYNQNMFEMVMK